MGRTSVKRAIVTGGMSGLGAACAERLNTEGLEVVRVDVSTGADAVLDVTDEDAVREVLGRVGPVDVLVNSAGVVGPNAPLWQVDTAQWKHTFDVNVVGVFQMCRAVVPGMVERGW
jgi:3-oxoacyl-[acyl-carrier protein] reductase